MIQKRSSFHPARRKRPRREGMWYALSRVATCQRSIRTPRRRAGNLQPPCLNKHFLPSDFCSSPRSLRTRPPRGKWRSTVRCSHRFNAFTRGIPSPLAHLSFCGLCRVVLTTSLQPLDLRLAPCPLQGKLAPQGLDPVQQVEKVRRDRMAGDT